MYQIIKRDGKVVEFDLSKISGAIEKAFIAQKREYNNQIIDMLALNAVSDAEKKAAEDKAKEAEEKQKKFFEYCGQIGAVLRLIDRTS